MLRNSLPAYFFVVLLGLLILTSVPIISIITGLPVSHFVRDPAQIIPDLTRATGYLSNIGVLFWASATAIAAFSSYVAFRLQGERDEYLFLAYFAVLSLLLTIDDFFLLHDVGKLVELVVYSLYLALVLFLTVRFLGVISRTDYKLAAGAVALLGSSVSLDLFETYLSGLGSYAYYVEDAPKFMGIVFWSIYAASSSRMILSGILSRLE